jgi:hypothetical protein
MTLLDEYISKKLAIRVGVYYYISIDGKRVSLGSKKELVNQALEKYIKEGKQFEPLLPNSSSPSEPAEAKGDAIPEQAKHKVSAAVPNQKEVVPLSAAPLKEASKELDEKYRGAMSKVGDISEKGQGDRFDVLINGVSYLKRELPVIKACPFEFYWWDKKDNAMDGSNRMTNHQWTVVFKEDFKNADGTPWLTVNRDDTPTDKFITNGQLILCYCLKDQFVRKREKKVFENSVKPYAMKKQRNEYAAAMAETSKVDIERSVKGYDNATISDLRIQAETVADKENISAEEVLIKLKESIDSMGSKEAIEEAMKILE